MRIFEKKIMRGPNPWSDEFNEVAVVGISNDSRSEVSEKNLIIQAIGKLPFLSEKFNIEEIGHLSMPELVKEITTGLLHLSGISCQYAEVKMSENKKDFHVVFSYQTEQAALYAAESTIELINALEKNTFFNCEPNISELIKIGVGYATGPTTEYLLSEVKRRKIPFRQFDNGSLVTLGYGSRQKKLRTAVADTTSGLGIELAGDKEETKKILEEAHIPIPKGILVYSEDELRERLHEVRLPVVIKPLDGNHGRGVTTNIKTIEGALFGYRNAKKVSNAIIVEEFIEGDDFRFLVINYELIAVAKRTPAYVKGDGRSTIKQLIDKENEDPNRGSGAEHVLAIINIDAVTERILLEKQLTLASVLKENEVLYLKDTANISAGGTATDVTDEVHPENKFLAEHIARMFNLDICGIDIMTKSVETPITRETGGVIEVNAGPGLRMHSNPQYGTGRNVAAPIINMLFGDMDSARVPVVALLSDESVDLQILSLLADIVQKAGHKPGISAGGKIFIQGHLTNEENKNEYTNAQDVLFDPLVDFALIECSKEGITTEGLAFDQCDVVIVTDLSAKNDAALDVLSRCVCEGGWLIACAGNEEPTQMKESTKNVALYSTEENGNIKKHAEVGGIAAFLEDGHIVIYREKSKMKLIHINEVVSYAEGEMALETILPAILAGIVKDLKHENIISSLKEFKSSETLHYK